MDAIEDKFVALTPCKIFDACLRARSLADANELAGSSRTCSILIDGNNPFSKTATFNRSQAMGKCYSTTISDCHVQRVWLYVCFCLSCRGYTSPTAVYPCRYNGTRLIDSRYPLTYGSSWTLWRRG